MDRVENFDVLGPRDCYDQGYEDGIKEGMERVRMVQRQYKAIEIERDWLRKKLLEYASLELPRPIVADWLKPDDELFKALDGTDK